MRPSHWIASAVPIGAHPGLDTRTPQAVARRWDYAKDHAVWPAAVDRGAMASAEPVAPIFANNLDQSFPLCITLHHSLSSYRRILTGYTGKVVAQEYLLRSNIVRHYALTQQ